MLLLLAAGVCVCAVLIFLTSPMPSALVLRWALATIENRYGVLGSVGDLDLNLTQLRVQITDLRLAEREHAAEPFLTIDEVTADLPWSAIWRGFSIDELSLTRPAVSVARSADGAANVPRIADRELAAPTAPLRLPIGRLEMRDLTVDWRDDVNRLALTLGPTSLRLTGDDGVVRGPLSTRGDSVVSWRGARTELSRMDGELGFDGVALVVHRLTLAAPEGELTLAGRVAQITGRPQFALDYEARFDLARLAQWLPGTTARGELVGTGEIGGSMDEPVVSVTLGGTAVAWNRVAVDRVDATLRVTPPALSLDALRVELAGGELSAAGAIARTEAGPGRLTAAWDEVDVDRLLAALGVDAPVTLDITATGELDARWSAIDPRAVTASARTRSGSETGAGGMRLETADGRWRLEVDGTIGTAARVVGAIDARLDGAWSAAQLAGAVTVACDDLARCARLVDAWRDTARSLPLDGRVTADLELDGTLGRPRVTGTLATPSLTIGPLAATDVTARVEVDPTGFRIADARLGLGGNALRGYGRVSWPDGAVDGSIVATLADLSTLAPLVPDVWAPSGRGRVEATVGGALDRVQADAALTFEAVELAGQRLDSVTGRVHIAGTTVTVDDLTLVRGGARAELTGWYDPSAGNFAVEAAADDFQITPLFPESPAEIPIAARLTFEAAARGTLADPQGQGHVELAELAWADYPIGPVDADVRIGSRLRAEARRPGLAADQTFEIRAVMTDAEFGQLAQRVAPVTGRLTAEAIASGTLGDLAATRVELRIATLAGVVGAIGFDATRPATVSYQAGDLRVNDLEVALGGAQLHLDGRLTATGDDTLTARFSGDAAEVASLVAGFSGTDAREAGRVSGDVTVELVATGPLDAVDLSGDLRIDDGSVELGDHAPLTDLTLRAAVRDGALHVDTLRASWAGATLDVSADLPIGIASTYLPPVMTGRLPAPGQPARVRAELRSLTSAALAGYLEPATIERITGQASAVLELELPTVALETARGRLTLPDGAFVVSGVSLAQRRPTELTLENNRVAVASFDWGNDRDFVRVGGSVQLGETALTDLSVTGALDLRIASAFMPGVATAGQVRLMADVTGPIGAPDVRGTVYIDDGDLRIADPRLVVSDITGTLVLTGDAITVDALSGEANGGRLEIGGGWSFGEAADRNAITFTGNRIALEIPSGLRSEVDVALRLAETGGGLALTGTATVQRGEYREPVTLAGGVLAALQRRPAVTTIGLDAQRGGVVDGIRLDVRVITADDVVLENNYLDGELGVDVRVGGTLGLPAVTGRVALRESGRVRFGNRIYEIETGAVDLIDPGGIEPTLTLTARTRVGAHDITLDVSGGRDSLTTSLRSEPPLPEADIVSVLLTGRTLEQAGAAPGAGARDQALGLVSSELLGQAGRSVGLDLRVGTDTPGGGGQIRFDSSLIATELNPGTRLTVGRDLSDEVRLIVSRSLGDSDLAWIVDYLPRNDVELRAFFNDDNARAYEFRHALSLGVPPRRAAASGSRARPRLRVTTVGVRGTPGFDADRLLELLALGAGDAFDFARWQRDRDRLEAFYLDQGFREARVRARRDRNPEAGTVALAYKITRGPPTELVVAGYDLPTRVRRDLDDLWGRAVFDTFLLEALARRVTTHLVDTGYLRSAVEAGVELDGVRQDKRITIRIDVGPHTDERHLVFRGVTAVDEQLLRAFVTAQRLDRLAWTDPSRLANAITAWYQERGRLRVTVDVGTPAFVGRRATLPVHVEAGPLFRVGTIELAGVAALPEAEVRGLLAFETGDVYTPRTVNAARAQIESSYRRAGYTSARVTACTAVDQAAATVLVRLDVGEGPRQVIAAVVVEGGRAHASGAGGKRAPLDSGGTGRPGRLEPGPQAAVRHRRVSQRRPRGAATRWRRSGGNGAGRCESRTGRMAGLSDPVWAAGRRRGGRAR